MADATTSGPVQPPLIQSGFGCLALRHTALLTEARDGDVDARLAVAISLALTNTKVRGP